MTTSVTVALCLLFCFVASIAHAQPSARDPRINGSINVNGLINPRINGSINPRVNGSINPSVNGSINPRINSSINPNYSRDIRGYYLWGINGNVIGIIVIVNKDFLVMFSGSEWRGFFSTNEDGGFNFFNVDAEWIGYLIPNSQGQFNLFSKDGSWQGFTT